MIRNHQVLTKIQLFVASKIKKPRSIHQVRFDTQKFIGSKCNQVIISSQKIHRYSFFRIKVIKVKYFRPIFFSTMTIISYPVLFLCQFLLWGTSTIITAFTVVTGPKTNILQVQQQQRQQQQQQQLTSFTLFSTVDESTTWDLQSIAGKQPILRCEGQSRKTFNYPDKNRDTVQLGMESDGRPIKADIELWTGPDYTPYKVHVYSQDGKLYPIQSLIGTKGKMAQVEVRNTAPMEFPFNVACGYATPELASVRNKIPETEKKILIQGGGAVHSVPLTPGGARARVFLNTDGRNLKSKIELLNGPNTVKQRYEVYTSYGLGCSLYIVFDTPGDSQYTIRIINENRVEFPAYAFVSQFFDAKTDDYGYSG